LSTLGADDAVTVLDDSPAVTSYENAAVLAEAARHSTARLTHLRAAPVQHVIASATRGQSALWQSRTGRRDIAPLRNLTLLLSVTVDARTTILVDDDICEFDLDATHQLLEAHCGASGPLLVGAEIGGTTEQDTLTKLSDAMKLLQSKIPGSSVTTETLFRVVHDCDTHPVEDCGWLSAGYIALRLPSTSVFAFPPGYNEDWLWCLLHSAGGEARLLRAAQPVVHDPPVQRHSTRDDIVFELAGDLIFDCVVESSGGEPKRPLSVLADLAHRTPDPSMMPAVRAEGVLEQACALSEKDHGPAITELESHGLSVLKEMLRSGELEVKGTRALRAWSADAVAKHLSFAATLEAVSVRRALEAVLKEGRK
jgi:hypothetical protein